MVTGGPFLQGLVSVFGQCADVILIDFAAAFGAIDAAELLFDDTCAEAIVPAFSTLTGMSCSDANRTASNVTVVDAAVI